MVTRIGPAFTTWTIGSETYAWVTNVVWSTDPLASTGSVIAASTASTRLRGPLIVTTDGFACTLPMVYSSAKVPTTRGCTATCRVRRVSKVSCRWLGVT